METQSEIRPEEALINAVAQERLEKKSVTAKEKVRTIREAGRQAEGRIHEINTSICQQPLDDRHPDCSGKFYRTQGNLQTLCTLCQRF
jgi:hypothetical protein